MMALAVLLLLLLLLENPVWAESHDEDDVRRRDLVRERRSAMERKWEDGLRVMMGA